MPPRKRLSLLFVASFRRFGRGAGSTSGTALLEVPLLKLRPRDSGGSRAEVRGANESAERGSAPPTATALLRTRLRLAGAPAGSPLLLGAAAAAATWIVL
jgi:hypothetical protein